MAFRRVVRWAVDEAGNTIGGPGYEGRLYLANTSTLASVKLDSAGALAASNPHSPNAGTQTSSSANMLTTDDTVAVLSSAGFAVGDLVPIDGSAGRFYGVIKTIVDGTHIQFTQTLAAMGGAATMNSGALVGGPEMTGHWQGFVSDVSDYDFTLKNLGTGKEGPPEGVATLSTAGTLVFQEEGVDTATRPKLNFIGGTVTLTDNAGQNRGDVTILDNQSYVTTASEASLSNEKVLGTAVIMVGTHAGRPAASLDGRVYVYSDAPIGAARDNGASWLDMAFQNPMTTAEDIIKGGSSGAQARVAVGATDTVLSVVAGVVAWRYPLHTTAEAALSGDVTISTSNTFVDGPSVSLAAGTWFITGAVVVKSGFAGSAQAKLWDGSTVEASGESECGASGNLDVCIHLSGIVVLGGTTTMKISATHTNVSAAAIKAALITNGAGNNASYIRAVRVV